jgi:hypothetical protein
LSDVEPVTLAEESFPFVLPGPSAPGAWRVGEDLSADGVTHILAHAARREFGYRRGSTELALQLIVALGTEGHSQFVRLCAATSASG